MSAVQDGMETAADAGAPYWQRQANIAPIKSEFVRWDKVRSGAQPRYDDDAAEGRTDSRGHDQAVPLRTAEGVKADEAHVATADATHDAPNLTPSDGHPVEKKVRLSGAQKKARARAAAAAAKAQAAEDRAKDGQKGKQRGQNKGRTFHHKAGQEDVKLCSATSVEEDCTRNNCRWSHDIKLYLDCRLKDIRQGLPTSADDLTPVETDHECWAFKDLGRCPFGYRCRFGWSHIAAVGEGQGFQGCGYKLVVNDELVAKRKAEAGDLWSKISAKGELNHIELDTIKDVRKGEAPQSVQYLESIGEPMDSREAANGEGKNKKRRRDGKDSAQPSDPAPDVPMSDAATEQPSAEGQVAGSGTATAEVPAAASTEDVDDHAARKYAPDLARVRATEKKRLDWRGKLYLAPLTTVGNLPFRRLCGDYGNDIFISEMGLAQEFLGGNANEWSLVRRHPSEKTFGVQVCGSRPQTLVPVAEHIVKHCDVDFIDVNCGCPIDLVFNKGAGSAMMARAGKLGQSLVGMSKVLGEVPLTIKIRTGVSQNQPVAHKLIPNFQSKWGVSAMTIHGRSRQQRYKTRADYEYISECARVLRETAADEGLPPIPIFGNGDAYDHREYYKNMEASGVDGIMIARGALIKPWIFTEIKERRDWDISSRERLDMIGKLVDYGLEHWGSDTIGVNHVRRFVCESLSFTHRYVPVGLLERFPVHMNERAYPYKGRDELETLLASDQASDWVKITDMFLGPAPDDWSFLPKHKASAADASNATAEVQG